MYELVFLSGVSKEFAKLDFIGQKTIKNKLILLSENSSKLKNNIKPLKGEYKGKFRLIVNQYRVIFKIQNDKIIIIIVSIRHREEIY